MIPGIGPIDRIGLQVDELAEEGLGAGGLVDRQRRPADVGQDDFWIVPSWVKACR
jgi:hypothetical protein